MDPKTLLFGFQGRINRAKYWLAALIVGGVMVLGLIGAVIIGLGSGLFVFLNPVLIVAFVVATWISVATGIKRLHDRNKSGWWLLLFYLVPPLLTNAGSMVGNGPAARLVASVLSLALSIWCFIELGCLKGTAGANLYGPDPLDRSPVLPPLPHAGPAAVPPPN